MRLLLYTHMLAWAMGSPGRLPTGLAAMLEDAQNIPVFGVASLWELEIDAHHALVVGQLPPLHRDPFDRLLLAQARADGLMLITTYRQLTAYPGPIRLLDTKKP